MSQIVIKKPRIKLLGIQELISQYEHHCEQMSGKRRVQVQQKNGSHYGPLFNGTEQKITNLKKPTKNQKQMQELNKTYTDKSFELNHSYHHNTLNSEVRKCKQLKQSSLKQVNTKPSKNSFSSINFSKKQIIQEHQSHRKISIKNNKNFLSSQPSLINSQTLLKGPAKSEKTDKNRNEQMKNSSYLSFKDQAKNQNQNLKNQQTGINLNNPTLANINKKIKQFEKRVLKKQNPIQFRKSVKPVSTECEIRQQQRIKTVRVSQTIDNDRQPIEKDKEFISIDTNYYGFSFKNKVPVPKNQIKTQKPKQENSTFDKSGQDQTALKKDECSNAKKISNSTSKIQSTKKPYATLNTEKKGRYQSAYLLKNKKPNSSLMMRPKLLLKDRYQLMKVIGCGMSGEVYQAKDILSDRFVVIKQIDVNAIQYEFFRQISHQNIIKYYNNFVENGKRYLVLEYFPMTLKDLLKDSKKNIELTDEDVKHIFQSVLNGLAYLHSLSIAHRDIKLDNIVISEDLKDVKFIDFGLCLDLSKMEQEMSKQFCGTLNYLPPQIVQGQPHEPRKADIWSLGIVLYGISIGRLPFKGKNQNQILTKISKGKLIYPQGFDSDLRELIDWMLEKNPSKRCTVNEIMNHSWLH